QQQSELLLASIEQKANSLQPIPFSNAVNYRSNKKYIPMALVPILLLAFLYLSGNSTIISQSLNRVVNYKQQFQPPAPFAFSILNSSLQTDQGKDFTIRVKAVGNVIPENAKIIIGNESYFMSTVMPGEFEYTISRAINDVDFHIAANEVSSNAYKLHVIS